jgi:hypothetical protein
VRTSSGVIRKNLNAVLAIKRYFLNILAAVYAYFQILVKKSVPFKKERFVFK